MRQILGALLLVALVAHSVNAECTGKTSAESYVGDVSLTDSAVDFGTAGFVRLPELKLGSAYQSFEMDIFTATGDGCLFSFGTSGSSNFVEARIVGREIKFQVGTQNVATSLPVVDLNIWQHLSIHVNNSANKVEVFVDNLRVVPDPQASSVLDTISSMPLGNRAGFLGKCSTGGPIKAIDNFFVTDNMRSVDDIEATLRQFFPILKENSLIGYFGFNEASGNAISLNGQSSSNWLEATLENGATRVARVSLDNDGLQNTDKVCIHKGASLLVDATSGASDNTMSGAPYFGISGGGYTNTLDCTPDDTPAFAINQRWDSNGAVIGVSIYSHVQHRWRVTPGANIIVERADWGGWLQVAESVGILEEDGSTYIVGKNEFQLQVAEMGWIRVSLESPTSLSYQYAVNSKACKTVATRDPCTFKTTDREKFSFSYVPMIEPMGLAPTTAGVGNLPATLACPTPTFGGYPYWGDTPRFCDAYQPSYESRCCGLAGKYYWWCPPKYEQCWSTPLGTIRSQANTNNANDRAYCCANFKYENGNPNGRRLPWCDVTYNDCQYGPFDQRCCAESLRVNVITRTTLVQCEVTNYDCWTMNVQDSRCCTWNWPASDALGEGSGLRYRSGRRQRSCPLIYNDCHRLPGSAAREQACCAEPGGFKYNVNKWRLEYCEPTLEDCWKWFTDSSYPMQQDAKCCAKPTTAGQIDRRFYKNAAGQVIALPWCDLDNKDCWTTGVIDNRCCNSDLNKYFLNPDGSYDYTRRLAQCQPTVDDCWGWDTNPTKFPRKVEDQRCCELRATRYHPVTGKRLDYCYPNFDDCWGYHLAGNLRDDDSRCCDSYPEAKGERLPYCPPSQPVPPPPPVSPPPPPVLSVDVCLDLKTADVNKYNDIVSTCEKIWGAASVQNVARLTCIATMCKNEDPDTPPVPDCRVERLLQAANPQYVLPPACTTGCPNGCYGRGDCNNRKCTCKPGWSGADCSTPTNYNKCEFEVLANTFAQCTPFPVTYQNLGVTQMLTHDFSNITVQYYDMARKMRDTTMIYMVKTIDSFTARNERFHLFVTNNDGTGASAGSYTMTLTFANSPDLSSMSWANLGIGARVTSINNVAKTVTIQASWAKTQFNGVTLFNLTTSAAPVFSVSMDRVGNQVVMACQGSTGATEVNRLTTAQLTSRTTTVKCNRLSTVCSATDCKSCAALDNCGWCVETGSCVPGDAAGPFVGQCFNWRYTFDTNINRRLTIIPGYPTNPRLTDVYLRQAPGGNELPIEVAITAFDSVAVPWDLVMFNEYTARTSPAFYPQGITRILSALTEFPNSGIALANLRTDDVGFNFIKLITNPRDFGGIPASLANLDAGTMSPATGALDVLAALYRAADPLVNHFNLRSAARSVFMITATRTFVDKLADTTFMTELRQRLLDRNVALVAAVPQSLVADYQRLIKAIGFGRVVVTADDLSNINTVVPTSVVRAASSIGLSLGFETGHVATTSFDSRSESYTIDNVRPPMRAKFWVPVVKTATGGRYTQLYFPTYGRSTIETVATDAPVGLTESPVSAKSDIGTVIELKGRSFRNLFAVSFNITTLPNAAKGNLFLAKMKSDGTWEKTSDGLPHAGELLQTDLPVIVPFGRVIYQPRDPTADGDAFDAFGYKVIDGCTESTEYSVSINVFAANRPPVAEMPGPRGHEGKSLLVSLGVSNPDNADIQFYLTRDLYDATQTADNLTFPIGKFCAYTPENAATVGTKNFDRSCAPVRASLTTPISGNKLIYVPPYYGHSFADPTLRPELLIIPCFSYKVSYTFTNPAKSGFSNELDVQIILDHENQRPYAWGDSQVELQDAAFIFDWSAVETPLRGSLPLSSDLICIPKVGGATCTYEEDFGERYWWDAGVRFISLGGYDVEQSDLTIEISALNLPEGALLVPWYDDAKNVKVGDIIPNMKSGSLNNVIRFRPEKEVSSRPVGSTYASFEYYVIDKEGARSPRPAHVDIVITPVDKPPRMSRQSLDVTVYETRSKEFPIDAEDPEGLAFDSYLVGCTTKKGRFAVCLDASKRCDAKANPSNARFFSCADIPATGLKLPKTLNAPAGVEIIGLFLAPKLASVSEGLKYETIFLEFRDGSVDRFAPFKFVVNFNVIKVNAAPQIFIADATGAETSEDKYTASLVAGTAWSSKIRVDDEDIGFGILDMNVTLDDTFGPAKFDLAALGAGGAVAGVRVQTTKNIQFRGSLAAANKLLQRLTANIDISIFPDSGFASSKILISVSDNGYTGQCPDSTAFSVRTCAQTDAVEITVQWAKPGNNNQVTVAASASAAAFAGVAAVAAALLFRKFQTKAESGYAPWEVDDNDEGIVSNPLYENNGLSGENPLFDAEGQGNGGL
eukprot:TRINITY_DN13272_c11_g1_i1.p1 TRINITY_DN13272_c11_g1~~TRINITY_DN13272_c11_g1_i1.p1  ORF type:complete len:2349 (-),score=673.26 TRINITY_DN13272_c11_g1_i1:231-7277(-)